MEYYIGQVFEEDYPVEAAEWCDEHQVMMVEIEPIVKEIEEKYEEFDSESQESEIKSHIVEKNIRRFQIKEKPAPTKEQQQANRKAAYEAEVDDLHSQKLRHEAIGDWTEEDEAEYKAKVIRLSEKIAERYPYPID